MVCVKCVPAGPVLVGATDMGGALATVEAFLADGAHHYLCFCEGNLLSYAASDAQIRRILREADLVLADGIAVAIMARLGGSPLPERIPGPSFLPAACEYGVAKGWRHFFYGGAEGVADRLAGNLRAKFPGVRIVGTYSPPFRSLTDDEERRVKDLIETARPHLLWVALGSPKQEVWVAEHVGTIDVPVMLPVGAAFDFHSGNRPWAPTWVRKIGMEWLFRTFTGGRRTFCRNCRCVIVVLCMVLLGLVRMRVLRKPFTATSEKGHRRD